ITAHPSSLIVTQGSSASFGVSAGGDAPFTYQWRFSATNISGGTASNLTITSAQATNAGNYDVVVSNAFGSITSLVASLTVRLRPFIIANPVSLTVTQGNGASFSVSAGGDAPLTYQWRFNATNISAATASNLTIASAQGTNTGNYD